MENIAPTEQRAWLAVSRKRAFLTHLCLSAGIVGSVCALVFFAWYPHPYFEAMGTWNPLRVLVAVDVVLGPTLTLIVFKPGKRGLKFDLAFIAVVQLAALLYGVTLLYRERPYVAVFAVDRFHVWAAAEAPPFDAERFGGKPLVGPLLVAAEVPEDGQESLRLMLDVLRGGRDIDRRPDLWRPYAANAAAVVDRARPLAALVEEEGEDAARAVAELLRRIDLPEAQLGFLPLLAKNRDLSVVIDRRTGMPVEVLDVDPWPSITRD